MDWLTILWMETGRYLRAGGDSSNLPLPLSVCFVTMEFYTQVNNGGFDQYFLNTEGAQVPETQEALALLDLPKYSHLLRRAVEANEADDSDALDELDEEFYELDQDDEEGDAHPIIRLTAYMVKERSAWDGFPDICPGGPSVEEKA